MNVKIEVDIKELQQHKLFIATPAYGGQCSSFYTKSCIELAMALQHYGIKPTFQFLYNESLVQRARNYLADTFMRSDCTHMLFIDADISYNYNDVIALLHIAKPGSDKEIVCGPYPKKGISWEKIKMAVDKGYADDNPNNLSKFVGDYVVNPVAKSNKILLNKPCEVMESGTGFMMIQRSAFEKFEKAYPQQKYKPDHARTKNFDGSREICAYFDCVIDEESKRYLSEDYMFCQWARKAGIKIWLCPWMELMHVGTYCFEGSLPVLAKAGINATIGSGFKPK